jgi:hypothetical protein
MTGQSQKDRSTEAEALGTRPRPRSHPPAELTVDDALPDLSDFLVDLRHLAPDGEFVP